mmetsp:Transcript_10955/g.32853  ORF Transcript_10955/g.32853 Transcript_10955/m.32853 type:complete len:514 (-) Transcript_10955:627-2168(-)
MHDVDLPVAQRELLVPVELVEHVAAGAKLEQQDEVGRRGHGDVLVCDEGVQQLRQHLRLLDDVLHLPHRHDVRFAHLLERPHRARLLVARAPHLAERPLAEGAARDRELVEREAGRPPLEGEAGDRLRRREREPVHRGDRLGHLLPRGGVLSQREQRVERPEQAQEAAAVHAHELAARVGGRDGRDRRRARLERQLAKVVADAAARELAVLPRLGDGHLPLEQDVKVGPLLALADDGLPRRVLDLLEHVHHPAALLARQRLEELDLAEEGFVHRSLARVRLEHDGSERDTVERPEDGGRARLDGRGPRAVVHERELAERVARAEALHQDGRLVGLRADRRVELAGVDDVKVVALLALRDDGRPRRHRVLPHRPLQQPELLLVEPRKDLLAPHRSEDARDRLGALAAPGGGGGALCRRARRLGGLAVPPAALARRPHPERVRLLLALGGEGAERHHPHELVGGESGADGAREGDARGEAGRLLQQLDLAEEVALLEGSLGAGRSRGALLDLPLL